MFREESISESERGRNFHISQGHQASIDNRLDAAIESYTEALRYDPTAPEPLFQISALFYQQGKYSESIEASLRGLGAAKALSDHNPHRNEPVTPLKMANEFCRIGMCYLQLKNYLEAHRCFRESLVRFATDNAREALEHIESTHFRSVMKRTNDAEVEKDEAFQEYVRGLPFLVRETKIGRGLFATRSFKQGDILFKELPLSCIPDIDNRSHSMCWHCLRSLEETEFGFASKEMEDTASVLDPAQLEGLKAEISQLLEIPPLKVCHDAQGNHYCSESCLNDARASYQRILQQLDKSSQELRMLLPTQMAEINVAEAEKEGQTVMLKELSTIEMMTRLLATLHELPYEMEHLNRLVYVELQPQPLLLEHQQLQLQALRKLFPKFADSLLTEQGYLKVKGIVELNTFSTETHALRINFGETAAPAEDIPDDADEESAKQLGLHILMREDVQIKGHALFRLGSLMNHSCEPNVGMSQPALTSKASWVALRDISIGEELVDSYVALEEGATHDRDLRRQLLFTNYHFWCNCTLCASGK